MQFIILVIYFGHLLKFWLTTYWTTCCSALFMALLLISEISLLKKTSFILVVSGWNLKKCFPLSNVVIFSTHQANGIFLQIRDFRKMLVSCDALHNNYRLQTKFVARFLLVLVCPRGEWVPVWCHFAAWSHVGSRGSLCQVPSERFC